MLIKKIRLQNFKSFKDIVVEFNDFNVLIGPNASGKSNFVQAFHFLRDISTYNLENAISLQGGIEYLRNIKIISDLPILINIIFKTNYSYTGKRKKDFIIHCTVIELNYELVVDFKKRGLGYNIKQESIIQKCEFNKSYIERNGYKKLIYLGEGEISCFRKSGKIEQNIKKAKEIDFELDDMPQFFFYNDKLPNNSSILEKMFHIRPFVIFHLNNIAIYDFDPKLSKKATPIIGKVELEEDGSNLSIVLKNLIDRKANKKELFNLINDLLPFIGNLKVEKFADKSLLFKIQESFFDRKTIPASLISDGTINITALILAIYFENKKLTIIEEPERNIHPYLISKVVDMMKDASKNKQIMITTHNPEVIKHAGLDNILLISRDEDGFSTISKPKENEEIRIFLKNHVGIDELFIQNLLK